MTRDEIIDSIWERANHGTMRQDIIAAFEAGESAAKADEVDYPIETEAQGFAWEAFHQFCPEMECREDGCILLTPAQAETSLRRMGWKPPGEQTRAP